MNIQNELNELLKEFYFEHGTNTWQIISNKYKNPFKIGKDNLRSMQVGRPLSLDSLNRLAQHFKKEIILKTKSESNSIDFLRYKIMRFNQLNNVTSRQINDGEFYPVTAPTITELIKYNKATLKTQCLLLDYFKISYTLKLINI
jgi:hypothetical protein